MSKVKDAYCYGVVQYGEFDVTEDRNEFLGGSDIPVILGISSFKKRFDLLLEKAGLEDSPFHGNRYTEYGHQIEPIIREAINEKYSAGFYPARIINGDFRYHADGFEADLWGGTVLEVKSTSDIHATADGYKHYLCQLIKGMKELAADHGILAVYYRPEDFSLAFAPDRLQVFEVHMNDHIPLLNKVEAELDKFRADLERLKNNPLLTEADFLPGNGDLVPLVNRIIAFENQLAQLKEIEKQCKDAKQELYNAMLGSGVKSWTSPRGTKVTMVAETPGSTKKVTEFDLEALKSDYPELHRKYTSVREVTTNGRAGYVRITVPK